MKKRRNRNEWYQPQWPPVAIFRCRGCATPLTSPLTFLVDLSRLTLEEGASMVPEGHYWPVAADQDFAGQIAVHIEGLFETLYHSDRKRLLGCCGLSGTWGRNRICACGHEIGTERSDCIWPHAVYLDPKQIVVDVVDA